MTQKAGPVSTRPTRAQTAARDKQSAALRAAGASYPEIAASLRFKSVASAHVSVQRGIAQSMDAQTVEELRDRELYRFDLLYMRYWPLANRAQPDWKAFDALLRISQRIERLAGLAREPRLDMEKLHEQLRQAAEAEGLDPDEVIAEAEGILSRYRR